MRSPVHPYGLACHSGTVPTVAADALLDLLHPGWQALIAGCLLVVTVLGVARLVRRGPARMTNGLLVTGLLILAITVFGTIAVSCSGDDGRQATEMRSP